MMGERKQGRVKWFRADRGFGFIELDQGDDCFFHQSQLADPVEKGDVVSFRIQKGKKGPVATEIKKVA